MVHLGYACLVGTAFFRRFGCRDHAATYLFCRWGLQPLVTSVWVLLLDHTATAGTTGVETPDGFSLGITGTLKPSTMTGNEHTYVRLVIYQGAYQIDIYFQETSISFCLFLLLLHDVPLHSVDGHCSPRLLFSLF